MDIENKLRSPEIDNVIIDSMASMKNDIFDSYRDSHSKRTGHRGFLSMIWNMFQHNKCSKRTGKSFIITIKFPINKWFK